MILEGGKGEEGKGREGVRKVAREGVKERVRERECEGGTQCNRKGEK